MSRAPTVPPELHDPDLDGPWRGTSARPTPPPRAAAWVAGIAAELFLLAVVAPVVGLVASAGAFWLGAVVLGPRFDLLVVGGSGLLGLVAACRVVLAVPLPWSRSRNR